MAIAFIGADMPSWCRIDALQNLTADQQRMVASPYKDEKTKEYDRWAERL